MNHPNQEGQVEPNPKGGIKLGTRKKVVFRALKALNIGSSISPRIIIIAMKNINGGVPSKTWKGFFWGLHDPFTQKT